MGRHHFCHVDRKTCIVMRQRKAVHLGLVQFAIFYAIHKLRSNKTLTTKEIYETVYRGVVNPPGLETVNVIIWTMNKKLTHLGIKIRGANRREHSFYRLVVL